MEASWTRFVGVIDGMDQKFEAVGKLAGGVR
jgi:hypothetical protein